MCNWRSLARYHVRCRFGPRMWPHGCWIEWNNRRETSCLARLWLVYDLHLLCLFYLPLLIHYAQLICGCHHGQFWLSYQRFIHPGISPFGRIYHSLVRIWSWRKVKKKMKKTHWKLSYFWAKLYLWFFLRKCSLFSFSLQFIRDILRYFFVNFVIFLWFFFWVNLFMIIVFFVIFFFVIIVKWLLFFCYFFYSYVIFCEFLFCDFCKFFSWFFVNCFQIFFFQFLWEF